MKASGSPPMYCFPLLYCLNFIAQFDKLSPRILKNSTSQDQTERKNDRFETPRLRDQSKTLPSISRSVQTFLRPTFVQVPFYTLILSALSEDAILGQICRFYDHTIQESSQRSSMDGSSVQTKKKQQEQQQKSLFSLILLFH